ncbi:MAG: PIN domain-containing protein [archaeon]|nr:PIN domain-containing protein [archaeon]
MKYYIDTSVYLNLWQKETDYKTKFKFWKAAEEFLQKAEDENSLILYSGFVMKELMYILGDLFYEKREIFFDETRFKKIFADVKDYNFARELEKEFNFDISFFDCIHITLAMKEKAILISRDKKLIEYAKKYCEAGKPEDFLSKE